MLLLWRVKTFRSFLSLLGSKSDETLVRTSNSKVVVSAKLLFLRGGNASLVLKGRSVLAEGKNDALQLRGHLELLRRRITLVRLLLVKREQNETRLVLLQSLGITLNAVGALVGSAMVDRDANS